MKAIIGLVLFALLVLVVVLYWYYRPTIEFAVGQ
jgi:hypothetical protein